MNGNIHTQPRDLPLAKREVGSFELTLLSAINFLRAEASGSNLMKHISRILGRDVAIGQLYLALSRLEQKGLISSEQKNPEPVRGGRSKKVFKLEAPGVKALERMAAIVTTRGALPQERYHGDFARIACFAPSPRLSVDREYREDALIAFDEAFAQKIEEEGPFRAHLWSIGQAVRFDPLGSVGQDRQDHLRGLQDWRVSFQDCAIAYSVRIKARG